MTTVAVVGATGRVGRAVTKALRTRGADVLAISRSGADEPGIEARRADVMDPAAITRALEGADAVVVTLGISEDPFRVRLRGARTTADTVRSEGTANVVGAMRSLGIPRLVVLSTFGIGDSAAGLSVGMRVVEALLLRPQFRDHLRQEEVVRHSGLAWTIARPVNLASGDRPPMYADEAMRTVSMHVGIDQVGDALAGWALDDDQAGRVLALSS